MDLLLAIKLRTKSQRKHVISLLTSFIHKLVSFLFYSYIYINILTVLIFQLFRGGQLDFSGSSTNKTDRHVITEILLTIALNKQTIHGLVHVIQ